MSVLENLGTLEKVLILFIILVFLKMVFDVARLLKKRKEYLKLKENDQMLQNSKTNAMDTEFESVDEKEEDEK